MTICQVNFDRGYYLTSVTSDHNEPVEAIILDTVNSLDGWYISAVIDSESASFIEALFLDDGPHQSEKDALRMGVGLASDWFSENDLSFDVDERLSFLDQHVMLIECPCCQSEAIKSDSDYPATMMNCLVCGAEWTKCGEVTLNPKEN